MNITGEHRLRQTFLRRALAYDLANVGRFAVLDGWKWLAWNNPECRQGLVGKGRRTTRGQLQTPAKKCFEHAFSFATLQKFCNI